MPAPVVVFAVGNRSRGDDALGLLLLERLAAVLDAEGRGSRFELIDDFQLQVEHALDLAGRELALFIDAGTGTPAPFSFYAIEPASTVATHSTHALPPEAVLAVYRAFAGCEPPPAFVLCVRGESFELGASLAADAKINFEAAWKHLLGMCRRPDATTWAQLARRSSRRPACELAPIDQVCAF
jgi:hydrogenase maturation protease